MRWFFLALLVVHSLIHLLGFAKAFDLADVAQLVRPVSKVQGALWLLAAIALFATATLLAVFSPAWWIAGLAALVLSQSLVVSAWQDAKFGTVANVLVLAGVVYGCAAHGPWSFRAHYEREVDTRSQRAPSPRIVSGDDLEPLPEPVRRYLRNAGSVGNPRVTDFRAVWKGRIRGGEDEPWMDFVAEQHNFPGEPARFFHMDARRSGLPVDVLHTFRSAEAEGAEATMRVKLLSLLPLADVRGPELDRAETVTLLNDLCLLAPSALLDANVEWEPVDANTARVRYTIDATTVSATLFFDDTGDLVDFVSDDRLYAAPGGESFVPRRWSTPVGDYRSFGARRRMGRGEGRWHDGERSFVYIELKLVDFAANVAASPNAGTSLTGR